MAHGSKSRVNWDRTVARPRKAARTKTTASRGSRSPWRRAKATSSPEGRGNETKTATTKTTASRDDGWRHRWKDSVAWPEKAATTSKVDALLRKAMPMRSNCRVAVRGRANEAGRSRGPERAATTKWKRCAARGSGDDGQSRSQRAAPKGRTNAPTKLNGHAAWGGRDDENNSVARLDRVHEQNRRVAPKATPTRPNCCTATKAMTTKNNSIARPTKAATTSTDDDHAKETKLSRGPQRPWWQNDSVARLEMTATMNWIDARPRKATPMKSNCHAALWRPRRRVISTRGLQRPRQQI